MIVDPKILSIKEEVIYPWKIDVVVSHMTDVQECRLIRTKTTVHLRTPDPLMAEGYTEGNSHSPSESS